MTFSCDLEIKLRCSLNPSVLHTGQGGCDTYRPTQCIHVIESHPTPQPYFHAQTPGPIPARVSFAMAQKSPSSHASHHHLLRMSFTFWEAGDFSVPFSSSPLFLPRSFSWHHLVAAGVEMPLLAFGLDVQAKAPLKQAEVENVNLKEGDLTARRAVIMPKRTPRFSPLLCACFA